MLAPSPAVRGPVGKHTLHLVHGLESLGCTVDVETWGRATDEEPLAQRALSRFTRAWAIRRLLGASPYDVLVVKTGHDWATLSRDFLVLTLCRRRVPAVALQLQGSQSLRFPHRRNILFRATSRLLAQMPDCLLVLSSHDQRAWSQLVPGQKVEIVANPYVSRMRQMPRETGSSERPVVLFVGRLVKEKGLFELFEATAALGEAAPRLVLVGEGPENEALRELAQALGLALEMPGWLEGEDLDEWYRRADIFVLPSWSEGFPTVLAEAMDAGLPIITTRQQGMADRLDEGINALFVPPRSPPALARVLSKLLSDDSLRKRMGEANRTKVQEFEPVNVASRYLGVLHDVVQNARSRAAPPREPTHEALGAGADTKTTEGPSSESRVDASVAFWSGSQPGFRFTQARPGTPEFFRDVTAHRYTLEPHIPEIVRFEDWAGHEVLEVGCGTATDGERFARAGASYTGVDQSESALDLARRRFDFADLRGTFVSCSATALPFPAATFDLVYSHGVVHHIPDTERAIAEMHRVLRPGGTALVMVYHRTSVNYLFTILIVRRLLACSLLLPAFPRLVARLTGEAAELLEAHRALLRTHGLRYLTDCQLFLSNNTDGPGNPLSKVYSRVEARSLFADFARVETHTRYLNLRIYPGGVALARSALGRRLEKRLGWHLYIRARKAAACPL